MEAANLGLGNPMEVVKSVEAWKLRRGTRWADATERAQEAGPAKVGKAADWVQLLLRESPTTTVTARVQT